MQSISSPKTSCQQGFTLIELSIVLVIIGLIVGGILTGQSLIKQADMRATLTQINRLNAAVNTFQDRYNGLPGDLINAASLGLQQSSLTTFLNDGLIDGANNNSNYFEGEMAVFFYQLYQAQILQSMYTPVMQPGPPGTTTTNLTTIGTYLMSSPFGTGFFLWPATGQGATAADYGASVNFNANYYRLAYVTGLSSGGGINVTPNMAPADAAAFDAKLDDGNGTTGNVLASDYSGSEGSIIQLSTTNCITAAGAYNTAATTGCSLAIKTGF